MKFYFCTLFLIILIDSYLSPLGLENWLKVFYRSAIQGQGTVPHTSPPLEHQRQITTLYKRIINTEWYFNLT